MFQKSDETMQLRERVVELERKLADCQERLQVRSELKVSMQDVGNKSACD